MFERQKEKVGPYLYFWFRVLVGLLFMQHGAQKLFGVLGAQQSVELMSLMGLAGIVEFVGGLAIAVGFFTRPAAALSGIQMLTAYFMAHASKAWAPIVNNGELALLFFATFLVLYWHGAGKWGLEKAILGKELC